MEVPPDVSLACTRLDDIWNSRRLEKCRWQVAQLRRQSFKKKMVVWTCHQNYVDHRRHLGANERTDVILVLLQPGLALGTDYVHMLVEMLPAPHLVIVSTGKPSNSVTPFLDSTDRVWECLLYDELRVDKLSSNLVPTYRVLTGHERTQVIKQYGKTELMPSLRHREDPIARLLGFRKGDVVEWTYANVLMGLEVGHRYVQDINEII